MPRLMGVDIPNDKQIQYSLTYLYGIGLHTAREVCEKLGIDPTRPASDIHEDELGGSLRCWNATTRSKVRCVARSPKTSVDFARSSATAACVTAAVLPVRGQRTKTNARTRKGPRKTVAGKKGVKDLR